MMMSRAQGLTRITQIPITARKAFYGLKAVWFQDAKNSFKYLLNLLSSTDRVL